MTAIAGMLARAAVITLFSFCLGDLGFVVLIGLLCGRYVLEMCIHKD